MVVIKHLGNITSFSLMVEVSGCPVGEKECGYFVVLQNVKVKKKVMLPCWERRLGVIIHKVLLKSFVLGQVNKDNTVLARTTRYK
jgi:hypothetical protein